MNFRYAGQIWRLGARLLHQTRPEDRIPVVAVNAEQMDSDYFRDGASSSESYRKQDPDVDEAEKSASKPILDAEGYLLVNLRRKNGHWRASVETTQGSWESKQGTLESVILDVRSSLLPRPSIWLSAHSAGWRAFHPYPVRIKTAEYSQLDRHDIQLLIDAVEDPSELDFSDARIIERDLSRPTIQKEWSASPYAGGNNAPRWKSRESDGILLRWIKLTDAWISGANLAGADLVFTQLGKADLASVNMSSTFAQNVNLEGAKLYHCKLNRADLVSANLREATLMGTRFDGADLMWADLRQVRVFHGTSFVGASLRQTHLEGVDLYPLEAGALCDAYWATAYLDRTRIKREQLGERVGEEVTAKRNAKRKRGQETADANATKTDDKPWITYWDARESYLNLKNNFNSIGRYADASWAYRRERAMERKALGQDWRSGNRRVRNFLSWFWNWLTFLLTDYGESPARPAISAVAVLLSFWGLYFWLGNIGYTTSQNGMGDSLGCWDSLIYSGGALVGVGFADFLPLDTTARLLTLIEAGMGLSLIALILFCIGNRISRS